jgi:GNAT superfamily N-acetyltransferase
MWRVAWDGDEVAGVVMNAIYHEENEQLGVRRGWLEHVSVRRPWRGRGLAKALCTASFAVLRERGTDEAWLGVTGRTRPAQSGCTRASASTSRGAGRRSRGRSTSRHRPVAARGRED